MNDPHLKAVIDQMIADGASHEQISDFVAQAAGSRQAMSDRQNEARAQRLDKAEGQFQDETSPMALAGGVAETLKDKLVRLAQGGRKLFEIGVSPASTMHDMLVRDDRRRELGRGLSDTMFGLPAYLSDKARVALGGQETYAPNEQADENTAPEYRAAGQIGGSLIPAGPAEALGKVAMKAVGKIPIGSLAAPFVRTLSDSTPMQTLAASQVASAGAAGLNVNAGGLNDRVRAAGAAASDPINLTTVAPAAIAKAGQGASALLRKNKTIGTYANARDAGVYERPDMKALPKGEEGMQRASEIGLDRIVQRDQQLGQEASNAYQAAVKPHLKRPVDANAIRENLMAGHEANIAPDSRLPLREEVQTAFNRAFEKTPDAPTVEGTLMRRRALKQEAGFGSANPTPAQEATREVYQTYRRGVRKASPEVAAADDAYTDYARQAQRRRDILFNTESEVIPSGSGSGAPDGIPIDYSDTIGEIPQGAAEDLAGAPQLRVGKARSAATTLSRVNDTNVPGLRAQRYLEELAAQDPAFAQALDFIAAKKALEGTRFGVDGHLPHSLHGATGLAGFRPLLTQNARAIGALAERGAQAVGGAGPGGMAGALRINPILAAYAAQRERERQMAATLLSGGRGGGQ